MRDSTQLFTAGSGAADRQASAFDPALGTGPCRTCRSPAAPLREFVACDDCGFRCARWGGMGEPVVLARKYSSALLPAPVV